jgi:hypothetical protein
VSTGIERGGRGFEGVEVPGVAGGVKAGLIIDAGGAWLRVLFATLLCIACLPKSSSEFGSSKGSRRFGCGLYRGGKLEEACEGSSDMAKRGDDPIESKGKVLVCLREVVGFGAYHGRKCE